MATVNGVATLPERSVSLEPASGTKRKRTGSQNESAQVSVTKSQGSTSIQSTITDVFEVLSSHDTAPAILNFPIDDKEVPSAKRAKTTDDSGPATVSRKVTEAQYTNLDELEEDIHSICASQIASLKETDEEEESTKARRLTGDDVAQMRDILSFELFVREVVGREKELIKLHQPEDEGKTNGVKEEAETNGVSAVPDAGRTVLSLFGNAPTGRQLFSSLQEEAGTDISLEELGLPTMLVATKLLPTVNEDSQTKSQRTIGDLFAPSSSLPALQPPPKSRMSSSRSTNISFLPLDKFAPPSRKGPYPLQPLSSGKWLRYGSQVRRKERLRDRSNSTIDRPRLDQNISQPDELSEEDLFTAAYSSFAPTRDDSRAIIPSDTCDLLWWQKFGKRRLEEFITVEDAQDDMELDENDRTEATQQQDDHETKVLEELVKNFDGEDVLANLVEETDNPEEMEAHALLGEITELIRTLSSHQRIRHSILQPGSLRAPSSPSPLRNTLVGTPSEPSAEEKAVYRSLQQHLATLISRLPPYLVAKLDGVQVEDLAVSKTFLVEGRNTRGVMEEDQATRAMRGAAAAAASAASKTSNQQYGQYGRWPGTNSSSRQSLTPQTAQRSAINYGRSSSGLSSATPVQANRQYSSYNPSGSRTSLQPNYGQSGATGQFYQQRQSFGQQGSPQPRAGQYATPGQQQFQQQRYAQQAPSYASYAQNKSFPPSAATPDGYSGQNGRSTPGAGQFQGSPVRLGTQTNGAP